MAKSQFHTAMETNLSATSRMGSNKVTDKQSFIQEIPTQAISKLMSFPESALSDIKMEIPTQDNSRTISLMETESIAILGVLTMMANGFLEEREGRESSVLMVTILKETGTKKR